MKEIPSMITAIHNGWHNYQTALITALRPLSVKQLALCAAPGMRSIGQISAHIAAARANWFYHLLKEGDAAFAALGRWDRPEMPLQSADILIQGMETTWQLMQTAIARWTLVEWEQTFSEDHPYAPMVITRQWLIWHLIEHDLHHGGEISLTMGLHSLLVPNLYT